LTGGVDRCGAHVFEVGWKPGPRPWTQLNAFSCDLEVELNPLGVPAANEGLPIGHQKDHSSNKKIA